MYRISKFGGYLRFLVNFVGGCNMYQDSWGLTFFYFYIFLTTFCKRGPVIYPHLPFAFMGNIYKKTGFIFRNVQKLKSSLLSVRCLNKYKLDFFGEISSRLILSNDLEIKSPNVIRVLKLNDCYCQ